MASKRRLKKAISKVSSKTAERIVAISLQHPELGARRLVPLLNRKRISVSAAVIRNILRREGLENRQKRRAQLDKRAKKAHKPKPTPKKQATRISQKVAGRIVELSLQNPDFGSRRLLPLLKKEKIQITASTLYSVLKRHGLQSRALRVARLEERTKFARKPKSSPKKPATKITDKFGERICEISLQNPDLGAKRLRLLLKEQGIFASSSTVYRILKRNDLENRQKRLFKLKAPPESEIEVSEPTAEASQTASTPDSDEAPEPVFESVVAAPVGPVEIPPALAVELAPTPEPALTEAAKSAKPERPPVRKVPLKTVKKRGPWVFYPLYLLLFFLIGYLGLHAVRTIQYARLEKENLTVAASAPAGMTIEAESTTSLQPLDGYRQIWERNLFNTGRVRPDSAEKIALAKIAPAKKGLGLELVGTVVADDPRLSRAIIDNRSIRKQEVYREGDSAGKAKIKKILRNNVVITTADGDELLTIEIKESRRSSAAERSQYIGSRSSSAQPSTETRRQMVGARSISLKREEVANSLADIDGLMQQMSVTPYTQGEQASGFRITSIPRDSVLRKMGLRSRDVIVGIDDETITNPDQAADFLQRLASGGEITIKFKRRRRTRQVKLNIQ
jgi:type II secretion system protein C